MHTAHVLTVSPSIHCAGGCLLLGGVCSGGSALGRGAYLPAPGMGGWYGIPACTEADPPVTDRMTDRRKNITLPQTSFAGGNNNFEKVKLIFVIFGVIF